MLLLKSKNENGDTDFRFYRVTQTRQLPSTLLSEDKSKVGMFWELETTQVSEIP